MAASRMMLGIGYSVIAIGNGWTNINSRTGLGYPCADKKLHSECEMTKEINKLENKLKALDDRIAEVNQRLPAHSVKPPIMMQLFELEDERDAIAKQIEVLKKKTSG